MKFKETNIITKNPQISLLGRNLNMSFWNDQYTLSLALLGNAELEYQTYWKDGLHYELEIILRKIPSSNTIVIPVIKSQNIQFHKQIPQLTGDIQDEIMPDNVINSFAVYLDNQYGNINIINPIDLVKNTYCYETGKILHIYRPIAKDAYDRLSYGDMFFSNNAIIISFDSTWLNNANYPVVIDPTFGYSSAGASGNNAGQYLRTCYTGNTGADASGANLDSITYYIYSTTGGNYGIVWGLYNDNGTTATTKNTKQTSGELITFVSGNWYTTVNALDIANSLAASNHYHFVQLTNQSSSTIFRIAYDTVAGYNCPSTSGYNYTNYPAIPDNISGYTWVNVTSRRLSVYGTYTIVSGTTYKNIGKFWQVS